MNFFLSFKSNYMSDNDIIIYYQLYIYIFSFTLFSLIQGAFFFSFSSLKYIEHTNLIYCHTLFVQFELSTQCNNLKVSFDRKPIPFQICFCIECQIHKRETFSIYQRKMFNLVCFFLFINTKHICFV